jgi:PilZ domain
MLRRPLRPLGTKPSGAERRRHVRREPLAGVTCEVLRAGALTAAAVVNLSEGGACLALGLALAKGDALTLRLCNHPCLAALTADAHVAWCEPDGAAFRVGCQFVRPVAAGDLLPFLR